jgi:hypothetical protein
LSSLVGKEEANPPHIGGMARSDDGRRQWTRKEVERRMNIEQQEGPNGRRRGRRKEIPLILPFPNSLFFGKDQ